MSTASGISVGVGGIGIVNMTGGHIYAEEFDIGTSGTFNMNAGNLLGRYAPKMDGTFNQSGGLSEMGLYGGGSSGVYNLSGGTFRMVSVQPWGVQNSGTFNYSGGELELDGMLNAVTVGAAVSEGPGRVIVTDPVRLLETFPAASLAQGKISGWFV